MWGQMEMTQQVLLGRQQAADLGELVDGDLLVSKQPVQDLLLVLWEHDGVRCLGCLGNGP